MNTISIEVLNPASLTMLEELEKLRFISIRGIEKLKTPRMEFIDLVQKFRSQSRNLPTLEEITAEVEQQRSEMYAEAVETGTGNH